MRIYLRTTPNDVIVPFDYQQKIVGTIHKWLGNNEIHDKISLYSFSWLLGGNMIVDKGYNFSKGATLFISFYENKYLKVLIDTILSDPKMFCGLSVKEVTFEREPAFTEEPAFFRLATPIFIKRLIEENGKKEQKFYFYDDRESNDLMTETLKHKMREAGLPDVEFDLSYMNKKKKLVTIHGIKNKASMCPVIIHGRPESKLFAWTVGLGNGTGISLGALL